MYISIFTVQYRALSDCAKLAAWQITNIIPHVVVGFVSVCMYVCLFVLVCLAFCLPLKWGSSVGNPQVLSFSVRTNLFPFRKKEDFLSYRLYYTFCCSLPRNTHTFAPKI